MITISQLKTIARQLIYNVTRHDKVELNDIRTIKYETGTMPRKLVSYVDPNDGLTKQKETPYLNDDEFILFDVVIKANKVSEYIGDQFRSLMPFTLIINIYGDESADELEFMMANLTTFSTKTFLYANGISIEKEPDEFQVLDGKENGIWWIRRRIEIEMNTEQVIDLNPVDLYTEFDSADHTTEEIGGEWNGS